MAVGFLTTTNPLISVIPTTLETLTLCPSVNVCPPEQVTIAGDSLVIPVIVAVAAVDILSIVPVEPEVLPVNVSPVVKAPDIGPLTLMWANISTSNRKCLNLVSLTLALAWWFEVPESGLATLPELNSNALVFARPIS